MILLKTNFSLNNLRPFLISRRLIFEAFFFPFGVDSFCFGATQRLGEVQFGLFCVSGEVNGEKERNEIH